MIRSATLVIFLTLSFIPCALSAAPKVVITSPDNGELDVDPAVTEIHVEYDQPMHAGGRSIVGGGPTFPAIAGDIIWLDAKRLTIPVKLEPNHTYQLSLNTDTFKGFQSRRGEPAEWYVIRFRTRAAGTPPPGPDVTPQQNRDALAALRRAIDEDYAYRDRMTIDWAKGIENRRADFENAATGNAFARQAAHLLRGAEDAHVFVEAGDMRIGTRANSTPPNVNHATLKQAVPGWKEHGGGVASGRFDGGRIGYILFPGCTAEQAEACEAALDELKDTEGLLVDARMNGGGDELAALRVAGRFVEKPAVYARNRLRAVGAWKGPFDRVVEPREDAQPYRQPVVILIGPKIVSSAESFVLMMKHGAGATLVGETTCGSSGRPVPHRLGNGVTVYLSSWEDQLPDGTLLEGRGVRPDVVVRTTLQGLQKQDAVLERGLTSLRKRIDAAKARIGRS